MKAKPVNFERGQDPKTAMNVGMTAERRLEKLSEILEKFGIEIEWTQSYNYGPGAYDISITGTDELADENLQIMYFTDELSQKEFDVDGGYSIASEMGEELIDYSDVSHDPTLLIKKLLEMKYGDLSSIKAKRIAIDHQLKKLKEVEKYLTKG